MCEALRELMKDEIQAEIQEALTTNAFENMISVINNLMLSTGKTADEVMNLLFIPASERDKYKAKL